MNIYDISVKTREGEDFKLSNLKGKVLLVVNTATGCGFTPQYEALETLYKQYNKEGLEVLDFPCDQFGHQAPGSDDEIHEFCQLHFNTTFEQMKKSDVNGEKELPLYTYLKSQQGFKGFGDSQMALFMHNMLLKSDPDYEEKSDIKWNFTKFVINRKGEVVARFEPTADMKLVEDCIKSLL
jgi:glutathione peroxidase